MFLTFPFIPLDLKRKRPKKRSLSQWRHKDDDSSLDLISISKYSRQTLRRSVNAQYGSRYTFFRSCESSLVLVCNRQQHVV